MTAFGIILKNLQKIEIFFHKEIEISCLLWREQKKIVELKKKQTDMIWESIHFTVFGEFKKNN